MWILPKQLISAFAQDTEALTSDSVELSQACAQSLMRRSKPSPAKTYLREWKAGNLMRLRYGAISSHFLGQSFLGWWTSSLVATRVSHSVQQDSEKEQTTQDTSGLLFQPELLSCDQVSVSLKTSKDISRWGCLTLSKTWDAWVIEQRGAYSQRLNVARLTSAKECSSWPTASTRDHKGGYNGGRIRKGKVSMDTLDVAVQAHRTGGLLDLDNPSTHGSRIGQLNPRWVETLMGLPVGWTMPSCLQPIASPASVAMMSSAGNVEDTTQTVHALGQIAVTTDNRTDELRLLGNGVVPATAALAFQTLLNGLRTR
jgi:hypothetical protein